MPAPIAFDGTVLATTPLTGVGRSFVDALAAYAASATGRCLLLLPPGATLPSIEGVETCAGPRPGWHRQLALPALLRRLRPRLLHVPVASIPLAAPCPVVATIHDLPWLHPDLRAERGSGWRHRTAARLALRRAAAIIVPSEATAAALRRWVGVRADARVHVVPHGIALPPTAPATDARTGPLLVLGDDRPRKNLARVRAAHTRAATMAPGLPPLQLVGPGFGYVDESRKHALLRSARALLHMSLHEGFGLPVLEAMAHGTPVVAADIPSLREVAAGAAVLVDPTDVDAMAGAIVRVCGDEALRAQLGAAGRVRAGTLSLAATVAGWRAVHDLVTR